MIEWLIAIVLLVLYLYSWVYKLKTFRHNIGNIMMFFPICMMISNFICKTK